MPRIIMGGNKPETIKKFIKSPFDAQNVLLIDLDNPRSELEADIASENLQAEQAKVCYMIQEMEAWLLSQPDILDAYYQDSSISRRMTKRSPAEIPDPKAELQRLTKQTQKGSYHEVKHGSDLLSQLDLSRLITDFPQVEKLIKLLQQST